MRIYAHSLPSCHVIRRAKYRATMRVLTVVAVSAGFVT